MRVSPDSKRLQPDDFFVRGWSFFAGAINRKRLVYRVLLRECLRLRAVGWDGTDTNLLPAVKSRSVAKNDHSEGDWQAQDLLWRKLLRCRSEEDAHIVGKPLTIPVLASVGG